MDRKRIAVVGLGNPLMRDEGIGIRVIEALEKNKGIPPDVEVMDMGTSGISLLHQMEGRDTLIVVDCALMDLRPGTIRRFMPDDVRTRKVRTRLSAHEGDLLSTLELAKRLHICPPDIVLLGIQPACVEPGQTLTHVLEEHISAYVDVTYQEVLKRVMVHA